MRKLLAKPFLYLASVFYWMYVRVEGIEIKPFEPKGGDVGRTSTSESD